MPIVQCYTVGKCILGSTGFFCFMHTSVLNIQASTMFKLHVLADSLYVLC